MRPVLVTERDGRGFLHGDGGRGSRLWAGHDPVACGMLCVRKKRSFASCGICVKGPDGPGSWVERSQQAAQDVYRGCEFLRVDRIQHRGARGLGERVAPADEGGPCLGQGDGMLAACV